MLVIYLVLTVVSVLCYEVIERPSQHLILDRAGLIRGSVRRPTMLRLIGMSRRSGNYDPEARKRRNTSSAQI
jgi:hypothetical protein